MKLVTIGASSQSLKPAAGLSASLFILGLLSATPLAAQPLFAADECAVIIASEPSRAAAEQRIREMADSGPVTALYESANGHFGLSAGRLSAGEQERVLREWKSSGRIPQDAYCASASRFVAVLDLAVGKTADAGAGQVEDAGTSLFENVMGGAASGSVPAQGGGSSSIFEAAAENGEIEQAHAENDVQRAERAREQKKLEARLREQERRQQERFAEEDRQRREGDAEMLAWARQGSGTSVQDGWNKFAQRVQGDLQRTTEKMRTNQQQIDQSLAQRRQQAAGQQHRSQQGGVNTDRQRPSPSAGEKSAAPARSTAARQTSPSGASSTSAAPRVASRAQTGNRGRSAVQCISLSQESSFRDDAYYANFSNTCNYPVFVFWCGDAPYNRNCGENVAKFYASSDNIPAGGTRQALVHGRVWYGACEGTIGFGFKGLEDFDNGEYRCLPTGDYARQAGERQRHRPRIQDEPGAVTR